MREKYVLSMCTCTFCSLLVFLFMYQCAFSLFTFIHISGRSPLYFCSTDLYIIKFCISKVIDSLYFLSSAETHTCVIANKEVVAVARAYIKTGYGPSTLPLRQQEIVERGQDGLKEIVAVAR